MKTVYVVAAIIWQERKILATQRGHSDFAGGWEFPGDKVEVGETPEQAIVREIREELGATIGVDSLFDVVDYDYDSFHLHMHCFLAHVESDELQLREHRAALWLDAEMLDDAEWLPADVQVIDKLKLRRGPLKQVRVDR